MAQHSRLQQVRLLPAHSFQGMTGRWDPILPVQAALSGRHFPQNEFEEISSKTNKLQSEYVGMVFKNYSST